MNLKSLLSASPSTWKCGLLEPGPEGSLGWGWTTHLGGDPIRSEGAALSHSAGVQHTINKSHLIKRKTLPESRTSTLEWCRKVMDCTGKAGTATHKVGGGRRERMLLFRGYSSRQQSSPCPAPPVTPAPVKGFCYVLTEKESLPATRGKHCGWGFPLLGNLLCLQVGWDLVGNTALPQLVMHHTQSN